MKKSYPIFLETHLFFCKDSRSFLDIELKYRILSTKDFLNIKNMYFNKTTDNSFKLAIINASVLPEYLELIDELSDECLENLFKDIISKSVVDQNDLKLYEKLFWLQQEKDLQSDNFNCEICKEKGLQVSRNCPFIEERNDGFSMVLSGEVYKECPKALLVNNYNLIYSANKSYTIYKQGLLPEFGGFYDQSLFFTEVVGVVDRLVKELEHRQAKRYQKGNK